MKKRILSLLMALALCLSLLLTMALAGADGFVHIGAIGGTISTTGKEPATELYSPWKSTGAGDDGNITCTISGLTLTLSYKPIGEANNTTEVYTAIPDEGFVFDGWTYTYVDGSKQTVTLSNNTVINSETAKNSVWLCAKFIHKHDETEFQPWAKGGRLPSDEGNYVLTTDVTLSETWTVKGTTNLCLNGHVIKMNGTGSVITVNSGATLNLYDCAPDATHIGDYASLPAGGCITGGNAENGGGVCVNGGTFIMEGGCIAGNESELGGGVYVNGTGSFTMTGGSITDNEASNYTGSGVYVSTGAAVTLGGTAQIFGNFGDDLYLCGSVVNIGTGANAPEEGMLVGIYTVNPPEEETPVVFANGATEADAKYFFPSGQYSDRVAVGYDNGKLQLEILPEEDVYPLYINGSIVVNKNNCSDIPHVGGGTVSYTPATNDTPAKLTLDNAQIADGIDAYSGITSQGGDLVIELIGDSRIGKSVEFEEGVTTEADYNVEFGIQCSDNVNECKLTFIGKGTLSIYSKGPCIKAIGDIIFGEKFGGTLNAEGYDGAYAVIEPSKLLEISGGTVNIETYLQYGIFSYGDVTINKDGILNISRASGVGILTYGNVTVNGGEMNIANSYEGIMSQSGNVTISGGVTDIDAEGWGIAAQAGIVTISGGAKVTVSAGEEATELEDDIYGICAGGVEIGAEDDVKASEVTVTVGNKTMYNAEECYCEVYGIRSGDSGVTIRNAKVKVTANGTEEVYGTGIKAESVTVSGGTTTVKSDGIGIVAQNVSITDGEVSVTSEGSGIAGEAGSSVTISGGKVDVTSGYYGIYAVNVTISGDNTNVTVTDAPFGIGGGTVAIGGGKVDITSSTGYGIYSGGSVTINGEKTKATVDAKICGIYAGTYVDVGGGTVDVTSNGKGIFSSAVRITDGTVKAKGATAAISASSGLVIDTNKIEILNANETYAADTPMEFTAKDGGYVTIQPKQATPPSSGGDYTPTVTVPVAGDKDSVKISATVSGSTAKIKNVTAEQIDKVGTGKEVTVDLSSLNKSVTGVTFPKTTLENIAESEASGLEVKLPGGTTAVFDKTTVAAIAEQAEGNDIQLVIDTTLKAAQVLTGAQKSAIQGMKSALVLEAYFTSNGKRISNFKGGEAELTVSYPTTKPVRVWYLTEAGALEEVPSGFDGKSASFVVKHFSNYVIEQLDGSSYASCPQDATCVYAKFTDANTRAWYHDGVHYCVENGMMNGVGNDLFAPGETLTRGMVVTMLARLSGVDTATNGVWYVPGQEWAVANGISDGTNMTANITREQLATMLYRYALLKGVDTAKFTENTNTLSYDDVFTISDWAASGMHFCIAAGVVNGDNGMLYPTNTATRAEAATMFQRLGEKVLAK